MLLWQGPTSPQFGFAIEGICIRFRRPRLGCMADQYSEHVHKLTPDPVFSLTPIHVEFSPCFQPLPEYLRIPQHSTWEKHQRTPIASHGDIAHPGPIELIDRIDQNRVQKPALPLHNRKSLPSGTDPILSSITLPIQNPATQASDSPSAAINLTPNIATQPVQKETSHDSDSSSSSSSSSDSSVEDSEDDGSLKGACCLEHRGPLVPKSAFKKLGVEETFTKHYLSLKDIKAGYISMALLRIAPDTVDPDMSSSTATYCKHPVMVLFPIPQHKQVIVLGIMTDNTPINHCLGGFGADKKQPLARFSYLPMNAAKIEYGWTTQIATSGFQPKGYLNTSQHITLNFPVNRGKKIGTKPETEVPNTTPKPGDSFVRRKVVKAVTKFGRMYWQNFENDAWVGGDKEEGWDEYSFILDAYHWQDKYKSTLNPKKSPGQAELEETSHVRPKDRSDVLREKYCQCDPNKAKHDDRCRYIQMLMKRDFEYEYDVHKKKKHGKAPFVGIRLVPFGTDLDEIGKCKEKLWEKICESQRLVVSW
ncbi:hypothetical protein BJ508DRAFT_303898 [Ascobolus immersus RN42]|uniref:Uncharacterized protein n=1 Tax=Ascobolus immersus RN42 TaxID=1160509 RepID=A0A3N4IE62_ASCIM|nr:hypothetical protein BJ508DRAFT_303898 [Ascobolus immersus RN42]